MIPITYANTNHSTHIRNTQGVPYLTFQSLERPELVHGFSTRLGGVSEGYLGTMNLSFHRGDRREAVLENHRRFAQAVGYNETRLVFSDQVHKTHIHKVTEADCGKGICRDSDILETDGLVTDQPDIPLITFYADCVPIFFYDPVRRVVALAHSGWRGTVAGMGRCMVEYMQTEYGSQPGDILCAIGPSICRNCYEISVDVAEEFQQAFSEQETADILKNTGNGKYHLDLWKANTYILQNAGIRKEHIEVTDLCTCCNPELLYSHRASQGKRGNLAAVIMLKSCDQEREKE